MMDVIEWLESVKKLDALIDGKKAEYERLWAIATDITARPPDGVPRSNTGTVSQKVENAAIDLAMLDADNSIKYYIAEKQKVTAVLEKLPAKEYAVMHRLYIRHMTTEAVAAEMGRSTVQIWRIKRQAIKKLVNILKTNENVMECNGISVI